MPNVTEEGLRLFVETFHRVLDETASANLDPDHKRQLLHVSLLPARITAYVSTQLGVAVEYVAATETSISVVKGSSRVEDLLVRAPHALKNTGPMFNITGPNTSIVGGTLEGAFPFRLTQPNSAVSLKNVRFRAGPWARVIAFGEVWANRASEHWTVDRATLRAKDEVLAAAVEVMRARQRNLSVGEYVAQFKTKTVLVLGAYDEAGIARLRAIAEALASLGYGPLLVKDVPDHPHQDLAQKISAIGAIARFVIIDDSAKSGHLIEAQICKQHCWVTALMRAGGVPSTWMTAGFSTSSRVILEVGYEASQPMPAVEGVCRWAEQKLQELEATFTDTYPWRNGG